MPSRVLLDEEPLDLVQRGIRAGRIGRQQPARGDLSEPVGEVLLEQLPSRPAGPAGRTGGCPSAERPSRRASSGRADPRPARRSVASRPGTRACSKRRSSSVSPDGGSRTLGRWGDQCRHRRRHLFLPARAVAAGVRPRTRHREPERLSNSTSTSCFSAIVGHDGSSTHPRVGRSGRGTDHQGGGHRRGALERVRPLPGARELPSSRAFPPLNPHSVSSPASPPTNCSRCRWPRSVPWRDESTTSAPRPSSTRPSASTTSRAGSTTRAATSPRRRKLRACSRSGTVNTTGRSSSGSTQAVGSPTPVRSAVSAGARSPRTARCRSRCCVTPKARGRGSSPCTARAWVGRATCAGCTCAACMRSSASMWPSRCFPSTGDA